MGNHASQRWARHARFRRGRPPCLPISFEGMGRRAIRDRATRATSVRKGAERSTSIQFREPGNHGGLPLRVADDGFDQPGFSPDAMPGVPNKANLQPGWCASHGVPRLPHRQAGACRCHRSQACAREGGSGRGRPPCLPASFEGMGLRASWDRATRAATVRNRADRGTSIRIREPGNHGGLPLRGAGDGYDRPGFSA